RAAGDLHGAAGVERELLERRAAEIVDDPGKGVRARAGLQHDRTAVIDGDVAGGADGIAQRRGAIQREVATRVHRDVAAGRIARVRADARARRRAGIQRDVAGRRNIEARVVGEILVAAESGAGAV